MTRAQERCVVIAEEDVGPGPEPLPILGRVARRLLGLPLFESSHEGCLRRGGLCEQEYSPVPQYPVNVLDQLPGASRVEPMKRIDRRHDIVVARKLVEPAIVIQVSHDEPSRYAIPLIYGSADRREEWVSIDAVDLRLRVDLPDGSAHIAGATTEIQRANGLAARKRLSLIH